jgi:hypothetical protein
MGAAQKCDYLAQRPDDRPVQQVLNAPPQSAFQDASRAAPVVCRLPTHLEPRARLGERFGSPHRCVALFAKSMG